MSEQSPHIPDLTPLTVVAETTIEQFEDEPHDIGEMYARLFSTNPNLALYLRRRAHELSPDLADRENRSRLALELASLLANQQGVNGLEALFSLELVDVPRQPGEVD